jgi:hypothetical protein
MGLRSASLGELGARLFAAVRYQGKQKREEAGDGGHDRAAKAAAQGVAGVGCCLERLDVFWMGRVALGIGR